jgi:hypothetical protein
MSLASLQMAMGEALLSSKGLGILSQEKPWQSFLKTPDGQPLSGCDRARLFLYEELLFASVEDTLSSLFPVTVHFLKPEWHALVEKYRRQFPNSSFQLYHVARDFPEFVQGLSHYMKKYPFLWDLALYEWLEIEVLNQEDEPLPSDLQLGFPAEASMLPVFMPVLNPIRRQHTFEYPIPAILTEASRREEVGQGFDSFSIDGKPVQPAETTMLIYRDSETFKARFFNLTPLTGAMIVVMAEHQSYEVSFQTLHTSVPALAQVPYETLAQQGIGLLNQCFQQKILLGSVPTDFC